jgi:FkbM family methyltransferase
MVQFLKQRIPVRIKHRIKLMLRPLVTALTGAAKYVLMHLWFTEGKVRTSFYRPYRGIKFEISPLLSPRKYIFFNGYEKRVTLRLAKIIQPGASVYVVGAHAGIHVLYIGKLLQGQGRVYAFEGWPENYQCLARNIDLNQHLGVEIVPVPMAVGDNRESVLMSKGDSDARHHVARPEDPPGDSVSVPITPLDEFAAQVQCDPSFILIDVEGHEMHVLEGAKQLIERCKPGLMVEVHGLHVDQRQLVQWLQSKQYTLEWIDPWHVYAH